MGGDTMKPAFNVATLIERYFTDRLMRQRNVSPNTIASYRDTFRLLFTFAQARLRKSPSDLALGDLDASFIGTFLTDLEMKRGASVKTRNLRLTAIRSFFRFVSFGEPAHSALIQRVLAIPSKRHDKRQVHFLMRPEIEAILATPDQTTWLGRRDRTLLLVAVQTGLRLSELISLDRDAVHLGAGAHVQCVGKGRKERTTPLTTLTRRALQAWLKEPVRKGATALFPNVHGGRLSADSVQSLLAKHVQVAGKSCPSLKSKRVSPHVLRHSAAMELLQAGVDCSVIALWLGHESIETTQTCLHAHLKLTVRRQHWPSSSHTRPVTEPASAPTTDYSPSWRRSERLNYAEWYGANRHATADNTSTTMHHSKTVRHSSASGINRQDVSHQSACLSGRCPQPHC
jgi:integrase/recombinase XerD